MCPLHVLPQETLEQEANLLPDGVQQSTWGANSSYQGREFGSILGLQFRPHAGQARSPSCAACQTSTSSEGYLDGLFYMIPHSLRLDNKFL